MSKLFRMNDPNNVEMTPNYTFDPEADEMTGQEFDDLTLELEARGENVIQDMIAEDEMDELLHDSELELRLHDNQYIQTKIKNIEK